MTQTRSLYCKSTNCGVELLSQRFNNTAASTQRCDSLPSHIPVSQKNVADFCRRWHVKKLALFGSVLREDYGCESDIDVLLEFEAGNTPGLEFFTMTSELSDLFGKPVDVVTRSTVERGSNYIRRKEILESAKVIYAAR